MNASVFQSFVAFLATEYECISQIEEFFTTQVSKHGSIPNVQKRPHPIRVGLEIRSLPSQASNFLPAKAGFVGIAIPLRVLRQNWDAPRSTKPKTITAVFR